MHTISSDPVPQSPLCSWWGNGSSELLGVRSGPRAQHAGACAHGNTRMHRHTHAHTRRPAPQASPATRFPEEGAGWRMCARWAPRPLPPSAAFPGPVLGLPRRHFLSGPKAQCQSSGSANGRRPALGLLLRGDCGGLTGAQSAASQATSLPSLTSARHPGPVHPAPGEQPTQWAVERPARHLLGWPTDLGPHVYAHVTVPPRHVHGGRGTVRATGGQHADTVHTFTQLSRHTGFGGLQACAHIHHNPHHPAEPLRLNPCRNGAGDPTMQALLKLRNKPRRNRTYGVLSVKSVEPSALSVLL